MASRSSSVMNGSEVMERQGCFPCLSHGQKKAIVCTLLAIGMITMVVLTVLKVGRLNWKITGGSVGGIGVVLLATLYFYNDFAGRARRLIGRSWMPYNHIIGFGMALNRHALEAGIGNIVTTSEYQRSEKGSVRLHKYLANAVLALDNEAFEQIIHRLQDTNEVVLVDSTMRIEGDTPKTRFYQALHNLS